MKLNLLKVLTFLFVLFISLQTHAQKFSGKAVYESKAKLDLGNWGKNFSEARKKQVAERLKNRLQKTYVLNFNTEESIFLEEEKIDAISGATDSWGGYFSRGDHYKNVKDVAMVQAQEFYGKRFLVKDELYKIDWKMGTETKKIGNYTCYKAKAFVPANELKWYEFSWSDLRKKPTTKDAEQELTVIEAWYTPQIPVNQGPAEFWGLPGLILEVSANNTTLLCTEIVIQNNKKLEVEIPEKGTEITKVNYAKTIKDKMLSMRNNRGRRRS